MFRRSFRHYRYRPARTVASSGCGGPLAALYWCDGKRDLAEAIRLTELEMGPNDIDFVDYFRFLERKGYVEFVR